MLAGLLVGNRTSLLDDSSQNHMFPRVSGQIPPRNELGALDALEKFAAFLGGLLLTLRCVTQEGVHDSDQGDGLKGGEEDRGKVRISRIAEDEAHAWHQAWILV